MNSGNLLNGLLGISNTNSSYKKTAQANKAGTAAEGFKHRLEELRPKVAVRQPDIRVPQAKSANQSSSITAAQRDANATPALHRPTKESTEADGSADAAVLSHSRTHAQNNDSTVDAQQDEQVVRDDMGVPSVPFESSPAPTTEDGEWLLGEGFVLTEGELQPAVVEENPHDASSNPTLLTASLLAEPALVITSPEVSSSFVPNPSLQTTQVTANPALAMAPIVNIAFTEQMQPAVEVEGEDSLQIMEAESLLMEGDSVDNPELLLNAKTSMNKLIEASGGLVDKTAPATDVSKLSLTMTAPAVESLGRLGEAQSPAARAFIVQTGVPVNIGQPQWGQAVGERVLWLAAQNVNSAEIRLDPPELGPMQVRVSVNQEQASVSFTSPHPAVREVLDQQLNRLREMFADQGLNLVNVDVSDKSFTQQDQERGEANKTASIPVEDEESAPLTSTLNMSSRLVDHYA